MTFSNLQNSAKSSPKMKGNGISETLDFKILRVHCPGPPFKIQEVYCTYDRIFHLKRHRNPS